MKTEASPAVTDFNLETSDPSVISDFMVITKARLTLLVLITTFVGFCLGSGDALDWLRLFHCLAGTVMVAAAAAIFNQIIENKVDRLMERTRTRPLPAGRWKIDAAIGLGAALGLGGLAWLALFTNPTTTVLAAATLLIYIAIYTP